LATSFADVCWSPWQATHVTSTWLCLLSFQSETILGVSLLWHSMHCAAEPDCWPSANGAMRKRAMTKSGCQRFTNRLLQHVRIIRTGRPVAVILVTFCDHVMRLSYENRAPNPAPPSANTMYQPKTMAKAVERFTLLTQVKPIAVTISVQIMKMSIAVARL
jgi:hypothetical protein